MTELPTPLQALLKDKTPRRMVTRSGDILEIVGHDPATIVATLRAVAFISVNTCGRWLLYPPEHWRELANQIERGER